MNVKLVSLTKSHIEGHENIDPEMLIVYTARVSNPGNQTNFDTSEKLIKYMVNNAHWSPFEMCDMTVEINTSRGIAQQILRHRSFSFQEFSQRYAEVVDLEPIELRKAGATNRQSSLEQFDPMVTIPNGDSFKASDLINNHLQESKALYKMLLNEGVAKECARFVLPITTQTKIYMKGSIRSWIHYLQIRCDGHTQLEHQQIALEILKIFEKQFPTIYTALNFNQYQN